MIDTIMRHSDVTKPERYRRHLQERKDESLARLYRMILEERNIVDTTHESSTENKTSAMETRSIRPSVKPVTCGTIPPPTLDLGTRYRYRNGDKRKMYQPSALRRSEKEVPQSQARVPVNARLVRSVRSNPRHATPLARDGNPPQAGTLEKLVDEYEALRSRLLKLPSVDSRPPQGRQAHRDALSAGGME